MKIRFAIFAGCLAASSAVPAQAGDTRLVTRMFNPDEVVVIDGRAGVQATIAFADSEHIENVAIGDSTAWQVTPNKRANVLFVKPLAARARTNLTVITDQRTYLFDLLAGASSRPLYVLRFTYPAEPKAQLAAMPAAMSSEEAQAAAAPPVEITPPVAPVLNYAWKSKGSRALVPARIHDDGESTFLTWDAQSTLPAILVRNEKGEEGAVNYAVRGNVIVVEGVPRLIVLRAGKDMATLANEGFRAATPPLAQAQPPATLPAGAAAVFRDQ